MDVLFNFNPRSREGSDSITLHHSSSAQISIHAPAKGATTSSMRVRDSLKFQSTLPRRERPIPSLEKYEFKVFQSTLPRRERQPLYFETIDDFIFQSTLPRRERRCKIVNKVVNKYISIHAPAKGATSSLMVLAYSLIFQSTLPRRERLT